MTLLITLNFDFLLQRVPKHLHLLRHSVPHICGSSPSVISFELEIGTIPMVGQERGAFMVFVAQFHHCCHPSIFAISVISLSCNQIKVGWHVNKVKLNLFFWLFVCYFWGLLSLYSDSTLKMETGN